ncbi:hypothetical protein [Rhodohalobacter sp.]|uniref:hypothetical protein n=1 Tax=Rhodohalobacter sp. TaxID=1974210 RepID=UPI002ACEFFE9|nr:hypothetical protein [Rhodohalobacter sp.]MDZ7755024.1 hypothetical protein [Rhodohalobacter sp.]
MTSDFIGVVEIGRTYELESSDERIYIAETKSITNYKGVTPSRIFVSGTPEMAYDGQCEVLVRQGEQWLIYLNQDKKGEHVLNYCSHPVPITEKSGNPIPLSDKEKRDIEQLEFLKSQVPGLHSEELIFTDTFALREILQALGEVSTDQQIAYYLIDFNTDLNVEQIEIIRGFSNDLDIKITDYLKNRAEWYSGHFFEKSSRINEPAQYVFSIYYDEDTGKLIPADM